MADERCVHARALEDALRRKALGVHAGELGAQLKGALAPRAKGRCGLRCDPQTMQQMWNLVDRAKVHEARVLTLVLVVRALRDDSRAAAEQDRRAEDDRIASALAGLMQVEVYRPAPTRPPPALEGHRAPKHPRGVQARAKRALQPLVAPLAPTLVERIAKEEELRRVVGWHVPTYPCLSRRLYVPHRHVAHLKGLREPRLRVRLARVQIMPAEVPHLVGPCLGESAAVHRLGLIVHGANATRAHRVPRHALGADRADEQEKVTRAQVAHEARHLIVLGRLGCYAAARDHVECAYRSADSRWQMRKASHERVHHRSVHERQVMADTTGRLPDDDATFSDALHGSSRRRRRGANRHCVQ